MDSFVSQQPVTSGHDVDDVLNAIISGANVYLHNDPTPAGAQVQTTAKTATTSNDLLMFALIAVGIYFLMK